MVLKITFPSKLVNLKQYKEVKETNSIGTLREHTPIDKLINQNSVNVNEINQSNLTEMQNKNQVLERKELIMENTARNLNYENQQMSDEELKAKMMRENKRWQFGNILAIPRNGKWYKFNLSLSASQLAQMYMDGTIYYDPSIQRGVRVTPKGDIKPLIYNANVNIILQKMLDGSMDAGVVLLNYAKEYQNSLDYDENTKTLAGIGALAICDAAHRLEAFVKWYKKYQKNPDSIKNPDEFFMPTTIFNFNHSEAENLFVEANSKGKPISKTRIAYHDVFNPNRSLAEALERNALRGKVESISNTIKQKSSAIITYKNLLSGVSSFQIRTQQEADEVSNYLNEFWYELINLFPQSMGNVTPEVKAEQRKQNFAIESMWISAYFAVAEKLYGDSEWKNKLKKLTENDFLARTAPHWKPVLIDDKVVNRSSTQNYVKNIMIDYVAKGKPIEELC